MRSPSRGRSCRPRTASSSSGSPASSRPTPGPTWSATRTSIRSIRALIAAAEPVVALFAGPGPDTWRIAAQVVAALASLALLFPLFGLTRSLFDERIACMAVAIYALLPVPAEVGHDTLSDSLGLLATLTCLRRCGAIAIRTGSWRLALAAGLAAGIGYLARPEVILAPARARAGLAVHARSQAGRAFEPLGLARHAGARALGPRLGRRLCPGQGPGLREARAAARGRAGTAADHGPAVPQLWLPKGLDDPRWDFSAKEEARPAHDPEPAKAPASGSSSSGGTSSAGASPSWPSGDWSASGSSSASAGIAIRRRPRHGPSDCVHRGLRDGLPPGPGAARHGPRLPLGPAHAAPGPDLGPLGGGGDVRLPPRAGREAALEPPRGLGHGHRAAWAWWSRSSSPTSSGRATPRGGGTGPPGTGWPSTPGPARPCSTPAAGRGSSRACRGTTTGTSARR